MSWKESKLGIVCDIIGGKPAPKEPDAFDIDGIPFVRMKDLGRYHLTTDLVKTDDKISFAYAKMNNLTPVPKGAILVPRSGSVALNHRAILGQDSIIVSHICALKVKDEVELNNKFLYYLLCRYDMNQIAKKTTGLDAINFSDLGNINIAYPDLDTQNKIVAILDKANGLVKKREETITKYDELLRATFLDMFGDPIINPKGWRKERLENLTNKITDGKHGDCENENNSGYYFISAKDLNKGKIDYSGAREITKKDFEETHKRTRLKKDDVLIGNTGASIGKLAIVTNEEKAEKTTFQKSVAIVTVDEINITAHYLFAYLIPNKEYLERISSGSGQKNLLLSQLRNLEIIVPSFDIQKLFSSIVLKIEASKERLFQSHRLLKELSAALSQLAFKGELSFNTAVDLEVLLENDYDFFKTNSTAQSIQLLLKRLDKNELNDKKIYEEEVYNKAKSFVLGLLQEGKVKQAFDAETETVKLVLA